MLEWLLLEHMPCYSSTYHCMRTVTSKVTSLVEQTAHRVSKKRRAEQACARACFHGHVFTVPSEHSTDAVAKCARASGSGCARSYSWRPQHWVPKNVGRVAFGSCGDLEGAPPHQYKAACATTRARTMRRMEGATMAVRRSRSPVQHKSTVSTAPSAPTAPTAAACRGGLHRLSSRR
jgi:hypothetical protein